MINEIFNENCLVTMGKIPDGTSPPYDNCRSCYESDFNFKGVAKELFRITKLGGIVVWVVCDETKDFCETLTSFKQAIYFVEECGFKLLDTMVYAKKSCPPGYPGLMRYTPAWEYMFIFSKGRPNTFNPIQIEKELASVGDSSCSYRGADGVLKGKKIKAHKLTKSDCNFWVFSVGRGHSAKDGIGSLHPAIFPDELAEDAIFTWSNKGEIVYDPFMGSGTVAKAANKLGRNYIGSEISAEYCEIIKKRLA